MTATRRFDVVVVGGEPDSEAGRGEGRLSLWRPLTELAVHSQARIVWNVDTQHGSRVQCTCLLSNPQHAGSITSHVGVAWIADDW